MRHGVIHAIAVTLCECDGKDWSCLVPAERDRYARIAILIDDRVQAAGQGEAEPNRITVPLGDASASCAASRLGIV